MPNQYARCPQCIAIQPLDECDWAARRGIEMAPPPNDDDLMTLHEDEPRMGACCNCGFEQPLADWTAGVFYMPTGRNKPAGTLF